MQSCVDLAESVIRECGSCLSNTTLKIKQLHTTMCFCEKSRIHLHKFHMCLNYFILVVLNVLLALTNPNIETQEACTSTLHVVYIQLYLGTSLLCFYFYPLCYATVLLKLTYYAQYYAQKEELLSKYYTFYMQFFMNNSLQVTDNFYILTVLLECIRKL